ncbi:transcription factor Jra isoform X2 [Uranotaenia lowii]|uniref:transcription factor Jra isoform X2 n=1 Tax=Uranotaenia lowii TaxID=190385 RepID=UPI00247843E1|nr:transcription factor Jra isoform X2 [Uranotaenia lowii]
MRNNIAANNNNNNTNMESFYEDSNGQYVPATNQTLTTTNPAGNSLKRPATLELNPGKSRKARFNASVTAPPVLTSPDLQVLKLVSPELEKIITNNATLPTPTPSSLLYPIKATTEQEQFAKGFDEALRRRHEEDNLNKMNNNNNNNSSSNNNNNNPSVVTLTTAASIVSTATTTTHNTMSGGVMIYTDLDAKSAIKEEPQPVPSPPVSPIDMENQERIKLERKRLRNRVAASKCRKRKLERISKLEDKVKDLKTQNSELCSIVFQLKQNVIQLKQQVIEHHNSGCTITLTGKF